MFEQALAALPVRSLNNTLLVLWGLSFVGAFILAFPPSRLKPWRKYLAGWFVFGLVQAVLLVLTIEIIDRAVESGDDGAGLVVLPGIMTLPLLVMLFLFFLRGVVGYARFLWRQLSEKNATSG